MRQSIAHTNNRTTRGAAAFFAIGATALIASTFATSVATNIKNKRTLDDLMSLSQEHGRHFDHNDEALQQVTRDLNHVIDAVNTITDDLKNWVSNAVLIKDMGTFTNAMRTTALCIQHAALQFISAARLGPTSLG